MRSHYVITNHAHAAYTGVFQQYCNYGIEIAEKGFLLNYDMTETVVNDESLGNFITRGESK